MLTHTHTHVPTQTKTNQPTGKLFFHNSGGQRANIKVLASCLSPWRVQERKFHCLFRFWWLEAAFGLWLHHPGIWLCFCRTFSSAFYRDTWHWTKAIIWIVQSDLSLRHLQRFFFPSEVTLTGIGMWTYFEGHSTNSSHFVCVCFETWLIARLTLNSLCVWGWPKFVTLLFLLLRCWNCRLCHPTWQTKKNSQFVLNIILSSRPLGWCQFALLFYLNWEELPDILESGGLLFGRGHKLGNINNINIKRKYKY